MYETFDTPRYLRGQIEISYVPYTAEWQVSRKSMVRYNDVAAFTTYGTDRASAYRLLEDALNLRDIRIYDTIEDADGRERRVLNAKETTLAAQKQQLIRDAFKDWIWKDPERRETLVRQYNEEMNSTRPREYDGSHIVFSGMNPEITLREHQKNAIAHVLYGGNTLLAHEVGAGKTFEMVASAMESKRLGLCQKSIFVVPNHLTEQWASEFLRLYPSANILVTTKKDFETHNRKKFCARIATGDYDAVIIGHSQFERIPISPERQEQLLHQQIEEITDGIQDTKLAGGNSFTIKSLERTKKGLEARLKKLQASDRKDDVIYFEQLGVDRMFVDESDNYKNLFLYYCRHSEADVESRCHKMRLNAAELEQAVFLTLKKQMEAAAPFAPDGSLRVDASVPERAEYEQQIETLQDGKRTLYEHYLMGEIDLNTYKAEKAACNELLLKTKNAYAAVLAQAKQKQDEQARQDSRKEASKAIFDADTLTTELAELLIDRVLVYPDKRIEIAYRIQDIFD